MTFKSGNRANPAGRPRGARNKLDSFAYACVLAHVQHKFSNPPPEEYAQTTLWKALTVAFMESPRDYLARIISMLPKELHVETSTVTELADEEIDQMIEALRARVLAAREEQALDVRLIEHAH
jgi:hypothetical protein